MQGAGGGPSGAGVVHLGLGPVQLLLDPVEGVVADPLLLAQGHEPGALGRQRLPPQGDQARGVGTPGAGLLQRVQPRPVFPLQEVAGEFGVFPEEIWSPPLVPEEVDETPPVAAAAVTTVTVAAMVERVRVTEHFLAVEYIPVRVPERRMRPRVAEVA